MSNLLYQELASLAQDYRNCLTSGNDEWRKLHAERIATLVGNHMPSGAGIDTGTSYDLDEWTASKMVFHCSFLHMNDVGYYDGWTEHTITVRPSFDGVELSISGRDRNDIKNHLHGCFDTALSQEIKREEIAA